MAKCIECGKRFNVSEARDEYNSYPEFDGELNYDENCSGMCGNCAISETSSNINLGIAIDMMNGEEEHDDDFVIKWL